jgi:tetratricopeptide (TPR) repeat protein
MMRPRPLGLLLLLVTLVVFLPTTFNQFINYDDGIYVVDNPFVNQGLTWLGIKWAFAGAHASNWHPLTWLSHMLDCDLFRLSPAGPHLVNSLFHAANTALVFTLILRFTNPAARIGEPELKPANLWLAAFVAALFAWHPLHVESVAWVAERKDVLSTFFSLLALLSYLQYARGRSGLDGCGNGETNLVSQTGRQYAFTLIWFVLALLSKPMPVTLPVVMLILDFWPLKRWCPEPGRLKVAGLLLFEKLPFFILSAVVCVITVFAQHHAESTFANISPATRLENALTAYTGYLGKMIWPQGLVILYPYQPDISHTLLAESVLILIGISVLAWLERKANPYLLTGWLWFLVTLVPVIGLIQVGAQSMADRYTYFPSIGIFLAAAFSMQALADRFVFLTKWLAGGAVVVLVACLVLTECQLVYWHDSETLFRHAIAVEDGDVARLNLGSALQDKNELKEAMTQFLVAWRLHPDSTLANFNVAGILATQGKFELAAAFYERAAKENTWNLLVFENYGRDLVTLKRYNEAAKAFARAIEIDPQAAGPHFLLARLYLKLGRDLEAIPELDKAMELEPQNLQMVLFAASVLASCDDPQVRNGKRAKELARYAVELTQGQQAAPLDALAMSSAELGQFPDAVLTEVQAIQAAKAANQQDGLDLLQKHLESYQKNQPWRESFKAN